MGEDLPPTLVTAAYFGRKCPRCGARATSGRGAQFTPECYWLGYDVRAGFKCRKEIRDGRNARKP